MKEFDIDWNRILKNDPLKCAQSLICQIVAGAEQDNKDVFPLIHLLEYVSTNKNINNETNAHRLNVFSSKNLGMQWMLVHRKKSK